MTADEILATITTPTPDVPANEPESAAAIVQRVLQHFNLTPKQPAPMSPFVLSHLPREAFSYSRYMREHGMSKADAKRVVQAFKREKVYLNDTYQVNVQPPSGDDPNGYPSIIHLSIKRRDREPIHDWRELQQIKNALVGAENEAIELYPAESRLVDTANQYHLWVLEDPRKRFPFGFRERLVLGMSTAGAVQRPLADDMSHPTTPVQEPQQ